MEGAHEKIKLASSFN